MRWLPDAKGLSCFLPNELGLKYPFSSHASLRELGCAPIDEIVGILLTDWSYSVVPQTKIGIRVQNPIRIPTSDSEPEPDLV